MNDKKKRWKGVTIVVALLVVTNLATFLISNLASFAMPGGKVMVSRHVFNNIKGFEKLINIKEKLDKYYLNDYDFNKVIDGAAKGMVDAVGDPYTTYMDAEEFSDFFSQTEGNYVGLGIQVGVKDDKITVITVFENSPAEKAGILSGDVIVGVDGKAMTGSDLQTAVSMMKGEAGQEVQLSLYRESKGDFEVTAVREEVEMVTVRSEMIDNEVGYIQVTMFDENTAENFQKAITTLEDSGMKSLIVDLRGNPGGLLDQTVKMASQFIEKGKNIVYTEDKYGNRKDYNSEGGIAQGLPLTVLTDGGSASASEIFTGAIKDYDAGTIVGTTTFGKGLVQTTFYREVDGFNDGTALKVTISKYYTPNGQNIHGIGIEPDVVVEYPEELALAAYDRGKDPQFAKALQIAREKIGN